MKGKILNLIRGICGTKHIIPQLTQLPYELRRHQLIEHILHSTEQGVSNEKYTNNEIIVSLTSYDKRIFDVAFTIESLMQQSMKANRIILWLDHSFEKIRLPQLLIRQKERGLEINYCTDIRSYKKLIPTLHLCPESVIITVDDDVLYDIDFLERLIVPYLSNPKYIYCHRFHKITFDKKGDILPYQQWNWKNNDNKPSHLNFFTGVGGVLYPPYTLDEEVFNESVFMDICKYADDVWFNAMAIKKGTLVKKVNSRSEYGEDYIINDSVQDISLAKINVQGESLNDKQIYSVFTKYGLWNILKKCHQKEKEV